MLKKYWKIWLGAGVSAFFLAISLWGLDLRMVAASIGTANLAWLIPGIAVYFVGVLARTWRWHYLLRSVKPIPVRRMWSVVVIGYMGNNIYPFRIGELLRAYVLKKKEGVSISASIATILVERVFDGLVMLMFVFLALPTIPADTLPEWLRQVVIWASLAFFGALLIFLMMAALPTHSRRLYHWGFTKFAPHKLQPTLIMIADRFMDGIRSLNSFPNVLMIFLTSTVVWLLETVKYWFVMHAFSFSVSFFALMLMNGVVNLATTLPSAPGYVGTFHAPGIAILQVFNVDPVTAAAYTITLHAALWLPITLLGFYYMIKESLHWSDFGKALSESDDELTTEEPLDEMSAYSPTDSSLNLSTEQASTE